MYCIRSSGAKLRFVLFPIFTSDLNTDLAVFSPSRKRIVSIVSSNSKAFVSFEHVRFVARALESEVHTFAALCPRWTRRTASLILPRSLIGGKNLFMCSIYLRHGLIIRNKIRQVIDQAGVTPEVEKWDYRGSGTDDDPFIVTWIENDPRNPMLYSPVKKWSLTMMVAFATLAVAFVSSAYSGGSEQILKEFQTSEEVFILGTSIFVLGFAIGPLLWAPLSELFGRQILFTVTYGALTAFNAGAAGSKNMSTLIVLRFLAGAFGSSPLTNAGGVIADMFPAKERGLAMSVFASAPFMGPVLGPIVGGFVGETIGWRWIEGLMAIFTGVLWIVGTCTIPETYPPVLQRRRAQKLSKLTGKKYLSTGDADQGPTTFSHVFKISLSRPWVLLFCEPIVMLLSIYMAIVYGTLYMLFAAFPIVYQETRGWSQGIGGLAFLGVAVGMIAAVSYSAWDNKRYVRISEKHNGFAPPETRLPPTQIGGVFATVGLFWFVPFN